jgi:hypothetical protein
LFGKYTAEHENNGHGGASFIWKHYGN